MKSLTVSDFNVIESDTFANGDSNDNREIRLPGVSCSFTNHWQDCDVSYR
jgi:hypothetical protein